MLSKKSSKAPCFPRKWLSTWVLGENQYLPFQTNKMLGITPQHPPHTHAVSKAKTPTNPIWCIFTEWRRHKSQNIKDSNKKCYYFKKKKKEPVRFFKYSVNVTCSDKDCSQPAWNTAEMGKGYLPLGTPKRCLSSKGEWQAADPVAPSLISVPVHHHHSHLFRVPSKSNLLWGPSKSWILLPPFHFSG